MNLYVGIETEEKGKWANIYEFQFGQTTNFEQGILEIPNQAIKLDNGELIKFYSIYVKETEGFVLEAEQNNKKLIILSCFGSFDVVYTTLGAYGIRFYTSSVQG